MSSFNVVVRLSFMLLVILLASCAQLKSISQTGDEKAEKTSEKAKAATEQQHQDPQISSVSPLSLSIDPMKSIVLPLTLIKGYDQVQVLQDNRKVEQAINKLAELQTAHPSFSGPSYRVARLFQSQLKFDEALSWVEKSIQIDANNYYALNLMGIILKEQGKFEEAKMAYQQAIGVYPGYANSHLNLAILADIYLYDFELALQHYQNYVQLIQVEDKKVNGWIIDLKRRMPKES